MKRILAFLLALLVFANISVTAFADVLPPAFFYYCYVVVINPQGTTPMCVDEDNNLTPDKSLGVLPEGYVFTAKNESGFGVKDNGGIAYIKITYRTEDDRFLQTFVNENDVAIYDEEEYQDYLKQKNGNQSKLAKLFNEISAAVKELIDALRDFIQSIRELISTF